MFEYVALLAEQSKAIEMKLGGPLFCVFLLHIRMMLLYISNIRCNIRILTIMLVAYGVACPIRFYALVVMDHGTCSH